MASRAIAFLLVATLVATIPAATAHTTYLTPDGKFRVVVGNLNEPATTYMKTGLDLKLSKNTTAREAVITNPGNLSATLVAPDGVTTLHQDLKGQFGVPGSYTFDEPYYLTQPGQYTLRLVGTIEGTPIDTTINVAGVLPDVKDLTFPDLDTQNPVQLAATIHALEAKVADLENQVHAMHAEGEKSASAGSGALVLLAVLGVALLAARRMRDP